MKTKKLYSGEQAIYKGKKVYILFHCINALGYTYIIHEDKKTKEKVKYSQLKRIK